MGELVCKYCQAKQEADSFEEADELIDHSEANSRIVPCNGSVLDLKWNEKPVAEIVYLIGPGSKDYKVPTTKSSEDSKSAKKEREESLEKHLKEQPVIKEVKKIEPKPSGKALKSSESTTPKEKSVTSEK